MRADYNLYPTLLDSFRFFKRNENEGALQEFLDKLNRVPIQPNDAMQRGNAFEKNLTLMLKNQDIGTSPEGLVRCHDVDVSRDLIQRFAARLQGSVMQVFVETFCECSYGRVRLYGFVDNIIRDTAVDVKTTGKYEFPKYLHSFQRPVYLKALEGSGVDRFDFLITDFREMYVESYRLTSDDWDRTVSEVNDLVGFIEDNRDKITTSKIFGAR